MKSAKRWSLILLEVILMLNLFGCGGRKYALHFDGCGFESQKTAYAAGEAVTVYFDLIATDTDYRFWLDDESVELQRDYDNNHGYVFRFVMPDHELTLHVASRNSMEYRPERWVTLVNEVGEADFWLLPETEANRKTTLWGPATVGALERGESARFNLEEGAEAGTWLLRILDTDRAYFAAAGLRLEDGYQIVFRTADSKREAVIEVLDRDGTVLSSQAAFEGVLGAE